MRSLIFSSVVMVCFAAPLRAEIDLDPDWPERFRDQIGRSILEEFRELSKDMAPFMDNLAKRLQGFQGYHAPEILPNGDIIIRRKENKPDPVPDPDWEDGVDL